MPAVMICTLILEAIRIYFYMRCLNTCIGEYRHKSSKKIILVTFLALWMFESFFVCFFPISNQSHSIERDLFFFLVEVPFLIIMSVFYKGSVLRHLFIGSLVPFIYWQGKYIVVSSIFSTMFFIDSLQYLTATFVTVLLFCILEIVLENIGKSHRERERELLEQEIQMYENQFDLIRQSQINIRSLKHDMKHHIKMLADMIASDKKESALSYLASMGEFMENSEEYVISGNGTIDSILNYMISKAKKSGITIDWKIQIPEHLEISTFDINVVLSNLFDNAFNALSYVACPALYISMQYDRGILLIDMKNNYSQKNPSSEVSGEHGFGLKNIRRITEKYHGNLTTTYSNGNFHACVLLFLAEEEGQRLNL